MVRRPLALATSGLLALGALAAVTLPTSAQAEEGTTFTGHVQVVSSTGTVVGCVESGGYVSTDAAQAYTVSIATGSQQNLTIVGDPNGQVLGVDADGAAYPISPTQMGYSFMLAMDPVPAGSPAVNEKESAIWTIDPVTQDLASTYVWDDGSSQATQAWYSGSFVGISADVSLMQQTFSFVQPVTLRIGAICDGSVAAQAITFTSAPPATAYPGQTYTVTATGGGSGNPVSLSSTTTDVCTISANVVSFLAAGTCTIAADQGGAAGYDAAPTATQDITVSVIGTQVSIRPDFTGQPVTGQGFTATATVTVDSGSAADGGGSVLFILDHQGVGDPVPVDADGHATSPTLSGQTGLHRLGAIYVPTDSNYETSMTAIELQIVRAATATHVTVSGTELTAHVDPVAPGSAIRLARSPSWSTAHRSAPANWWGASRS